MRAFDQRNILNQWASLEISNIIGEWLHLKYQTLLKLCDFGLTSLISCQEGGRRNANFPTWHWSCKEAWVKGFFVVPFWYISFNWLCSLWREGGVRKLYRACTLSFKMRVSFWLGWIENSTFWNPERAEASVVVLESFEQENREARSEERGMKR